MIEQVFKEFPVLNTDRLLLRQLNTRDSNDLYAVISDEEVTLYYDDDAFTSANQATEQIETWNNAYTRRVLIRWGICLKESNQLIGTCGYYGFHSLHLRACIGYELNRKFWRKGIMTEAIARIITYGVDVLDLHRIQAFVMEKNEGSIKLLTKLGFINEGILREYEKWGSKGFVDLISFSLLSKEWCHSN